MKQESDRHDFVRGIELFNAGRYFESHEALEKVWLHAEGEEKTILHGLIQAAAALLHLQRGNLVGARSLLRKARANLSGAPNNSMGLELAVFAPELESCVLEANPAALTFPTFRWSAKD